MLGAVAVLQVRNDGGFLGGRGREWRWRGEEGFKEYCGRKDNDIH